MYQEIIKEICEENNISYKLISNKYLIMLKKDNKTKYIWGYKFDLLNQGLASAFDDKFATYEILKNNGIPVIEHNIIYSRKNKNGYAKSFNTKKYYKELFLNYNKNIVLKTNHGSCGTGVYHITNFNKLILISNKLFKDNMSLSITPFLDIISEYRIIVLNKKVMLIYGKKSPVVIGDGKKTLKELLLEFNYDFFKDKKIKNYIPRKGEEYIYNFKFNLQQGSVISDVSSNTKEKLLDIVKDIMSKIDVKFCSIDIVRTKDNQYKVLEINSGVMMDNYIKLAPNGRNTAKKIYECAIMEMFK